MVKKEKLFTWAESRRGKKHASLEIPHLPNEGVPTLLQNPHPPPPVLGS